MKLSPEKIEQLGNIGNRFVEDTKGLETDELMHLLSSISVSAITALVAMNGGSGTDVKMGQFLLNTLCTDMLMKYKRVTTQGELQDVIQQVNTKMKERNH